MNRLDCAMIVWRETAVLRDPLSTGKLAKLRLALANLVYKTGPSGFAPGIAPSSENLADPQIAASWQECLVAAGQAELTGSGCTDYSALVWTGSESTGSFKFTNAASLPDWVANAAASRSNIFGPFDVQDVVGAVPMSSEIYWVFYGQTATATTPAGRSPVWTDSLSQGRIKYLASKTAGAKEQQEQNGTVVALLVIGLVLFVLSIGLVTDPLGKGLLNYRASFLCCVAGMISWVVAEGYRRNKRILGILIDDRNRMSLARLQVSLWTVILLSGIFVMTFANTHIGGATDGPMDSIFPQIPPELWIVMGISFASYGISSVVIDKKTDEDIKKDVSMNSIERRDGPADAELSDLVVGESDASSGNSDITRLQQLFVTVMLVFIYATALYGGMTAKAIEGNSKNCQMVFCSMPKMTDAKLNQAAKNLAGVAGATPSPAPAPNPAPAAPAAAPAPGAEQKSADDGGMDLNGKTFILLLLFSHAAYLVRKSNLKSQK